MDEARDAVSLPSVPGQRGTRGCPAQHALTLGGSGLVWSETLAVPAQGPRDTGASQPPEKHHQRAGGSRQEAGKILLEHRKMFGGSHEGGKAVPSGTFQRHSTPRMTHSAWYPPGCKMRFSFRKHNSQLPGHEMALLWSPNSPRLSPPANPAQTASPYRPRCVESDASPERRLSPLPAPRCLAGVWHLPGGLGLRWALDELRQECHPVRWSLCPRPLPSSLT